MSNLPIILVTGANQGLGFHACQQLAKSGTHRVLLGARDPKKGADAVQKILAADASIPADRLSVLEIDITSDASIDAAVAHVQERFGHLDVLVQNAAISQASTPNATTRQYYQEVFNVNVFSYAVVADKFLPLLRASPSATRRMVLVGSAAGSLAISQDEKHPYYAVSYPEYRSSKTTVNYLMVHYSNLLKADGIAVLSLCPGFCSTNLNGYSGPVSPEDGAKVIVRAATEGRNEEVNGSWGDKDGKLAF